MLDERGLFNLYYGKAVDLKTHREQAHPKGPYLQLAKLYYNDDGNIQNPKSFVWCDCDDFKYRCEVALALRGSSAVINSNGALPNITNPTAIPHMCKHLLAFLELCVKRNKVTTHPSSKEPKMAKNDRALIDSLRRPRVNKVSIKRMFPEHGMRGTRL
jgi:hypothetical protein